MYKVLIIEDDNIISRQIKKHIISWGYQAAEIQNFNNVLSEFSEFSPDLVLLDISLPFFDGYYWCREIRKISNVPIIFISSASENMNIVMAVNMGADDFLAKPFSLDVLTAKVQAALRRAYNFSSNINIIEHSGATLNISDATITYNSKTIDLTKNDYKILQVLMENKGKIVSREVIMEKLWQTDNYIDENTLTVNIARLRKKLETIGLEDFITTKKGLGYVVK